MAFVLLVTYVLVLNVGVRKRHGYAYLLTHLAHITLSIIPAVQRK